jgi:hypothetical protein
LLAKKGQREGNPYYKYDGDDGDDGDADCLGGMPGNDEAYINSIVGRYDHELEKKAREPVRKVRQ